MSRQLRRVTGFVIPEGKRVRTRLGLLGTTFFLAVGLLSAEPAAPVQPAGRDHPRTWSLRQTPVVEVVRRVKDGVVNIHSERAVRGPGVEELFGQSGPQSRVNGMGTGILIDPRGYIITNQHVVDDVALIRIRLADGTTTSARILARDHECDLALLKIETDHPLATIPLGTTRDLMVGETVIAIGNAYGYEHTVTVGVVSAVSRDVSLNKEVSYKALIQTDASINPGNSGGPLLNLHGELIGVNVAIRAGAQGIGFAIPVDTMIRVAGRLMAARAPFGSARGRLGIGVKDEVRLGPPGSNPSETAALRSVVVDHLEQGGPAVRAGLERGDILLAVGDTPIVTSLDLERALFDRPAGEQLQLRYRHSGVEKTGKTALESSARVASIEQASNSSGELLWQKLGLRLRPVGAEAVSHGASQYRGGLAVTEVRTDSPAERAGLLRGDILVGLHKWEMLSTDHIHYVLNHSDLAGASSVTYLALRGGQKRSGKLPIGE